MAAVLDGADKAGDLTLAALAAAGDRAAFAALIERHYDFIFRVAYRWNGRKADAEDIAQEVCVRLGKAIRGFRGGSAFSSWLYTVTVNAARDWSRKSVRDAARVKAVAVQAAVEGRNFAAPDPADDPAERLWAAVRLLPDKQREAVTLIYGEGLGHAGAAELMGCAESTVSWHVHEAKKRLKQLMRHAGEEA